MSQALYRKWRPHLWEHVVGQEHIIQTLRHAVTAQRFAHAYLFAGPRGTGKTTTARLLAKALNCLDEDFSKRPCDQCENCQAVNQGRFLDLIEIDAASNTSVEDVRDLREKINFSPNVGRFKVYIVDEVHMLSTAAFNALLKTLEEPPAHAVFILATTEVHKIPATVLSRCQRHEFRRIPVSEIVAYLTRIAEAEQIAVQPGALALVARQATGAMRDAISLLDQLASTGQEVTLEFAHQVLGTATSQAVLDLIEALAERQAAQGLAVIHQALDRGSDPRQYARQVVEYLRHMLMVRMGNAEQVDIPPEARAIMARYAQAFSIPELLDVIQSFNQAAGEGRSSWLPALSLEMALVEALEKKPAALNASEPPAAVAPAQAQAGGSPRRAARSAPPAEKLHQAASADLGDEDELVPMDPQSTQLLEDNWKQILALTRQQNPNTYGLLNSCKSRYLKDNTVTLGFASDVLKFQMEKSSNLEVVLGVMRTIISQEIEIRCITLAGQRTTPPPGVDSDGMVASALRDLGGEIVDVH
jgi:DNA polymerase III subunit gamma/tau